MSPLSLHKYFKSCFNSVRVITLAAVNEQSNVQKKGVCSTYGPKSLFIKEIGQDSNLIRAGTRRKELMRPWRGAASWPAPAGPQDHQPSDDTTHSGLGPFLSLAN